jgi:hypothetical protein
MNPWRWLGVVPVSDPEDAHPQCDTIPWGIRRGRLSQQSSRTWFRMSGVSSMCGGERHPLLDSAMFQIRTKFIQPKALEP